MARPAWVDLMIEEMATRSPTQGELAKLFDKSPRTIFNWLHKPVIVAAIKQRVTTLCEDRTEVCKRITGKALDVAESILNDREAGDSVRAQVALQWLKGQGVLTEKIQQEHTGEVEHNVVILPPKEGQTGAESDLGATTEAE